MKKKKKEKSFTKFLNDEGKKMGTHIDKILIEEGRERMKWWIDHVNGGKYSK